MLRKIREFIRKNQMLQTGERVLVGVSGGADSMCLLTVLQELKDEFGYEIFVVHVNHMIRGEEADKEEAFVKDFCEQRNILFTAVHCPVPELAKRDGISLEEAGRNIRYHVFEQECKRLDCHKIAIAHNKNDSAETVLFHLFRGSNAEGAAGIAPVRGMVIRPLLDVTRSEIEEWMTLHKISYCTDSSNLSLDYTRNKIRHQILSYAVSDINPKAVEHLFEFANQMSDISAYIQHQAMALYTSARSLLDDELHLSVDMLKAADPIICQETVKMAICEVSQKKKDIERVHILSACELMDRQVGKEVHLANHIIVRRGYTTLIVSSQKRKNELTSLCETANIPGENFIDSKGLTFRFEILHNQDIRSIPKNCYTKWFDYDKIRESVVIRTRRQGDFLCIHRNGSVKTLKAVLINEKVPKEQRDQMCLVAAGNHILWIPSVRTSEAFLVDEKTTNILSITLDHQNK